MADFPKCAVEMAEYFEEENASQSQANHSLNYACLKKELETITLMRDSITLFNQVFHVLIPVFEIR